MSLINLKCVDTALQSAMQHQHHAHHAMMWATRRDAFSKCTADAKAGCTWCSTIQPVKRRSPGCDPPSAPSLLLFYFIITPQRHRMLFKAINEIESAPLARAVRGANGLQT
jgi:hypothetical protein